MSTFKQDFNYVWHKPNNSVIRLIIINVAIFFFVNIVALFIPNPKDVSTFVHYLAVPSDLSVLIYKPWTIITSFFTHEGIGHIFWNMIVLYWAGYIFTEFLGSRKLIAVYILGGLAGGISFILVYNLFPALHHNYALGASASVNAIIIAAATLMPDYRINLLLIGPVKLKYLALVTVLLSVISLRGGNTGGEVAHLGGALIGFVYIKQMQAGNDWGLPFLKALDWLSNLTKPKSKLKVYKTGGKAKSAKKGASKAGAPDQAVVDRILDKISESGYDKLTQEEKQILFRASQKKGQQG